MLPTTRRMNLPATERVLFLLFRVLHDPCCSREPGRSGNVKQDSRPCRMCRLLPGGIPKESADVADAWSFMLVCVLVSVPHAFPMA